MCGDVHIPVKRFWTCIIAGFFILTLLFLVQTPASAESFEAQGLGAWSTNLDGGDWFTDIVTDPVNGNLLYACDNFLYKSLDGGKTWSAPLTGDLGLSCLAMSPGNNNILLLGGYTLADGYRIYRFNVNTGGFESISNDLGGTIWDIAVGSSGTYPAYVAYDSASGGKVKRCDGLGQVWYDLNTGLPANAYFNMSLAVNPLDTNDVLLGTWDKGIYRLTQNGTRWQLSSNGFATSPGGNYAAARYMAFEPTLGNVVLAGTNGAGLYRSQDGGANWYESDSGIEYDTPNATGFAFDPSGSGLVYTSVSPVGIYCSGDLGQSWQMVNPRGLRTEDGGNYNVMHIAMSCDLSELHVCDNSFGLNPWERWGGVYSMNLNTYYFAEGYTGPGFEEWLCMANFSPVFANAAVEYIYPDKPPVTKVYTLGANSRMTVYVNNDAETAGDVSVRVVSDMIVAAERPMYFNYMNKWTGGHDVVGAKQPQTRWYFAEGYTGPGFEEWLCMANPGTADALITVKYIYPDKPPLEKGYALGAGRRTTLSVNAESETSGDVSLQINSTQPIVSERPMYFDYKGKWPGGHDVMGAQAPEKQWYFAEGYTGPGFEEWLCLMNPNDTKADVIVDFYFGSIAIQSYYPVTRETRFTLDINAAAAQMGHLGEDVAISVTSSIPILAERPMYFGYHGWCPGGHDIMGANQTVKNWYFAEGYTGEGFEEWLCMLNRSATIAQVEVTYIYPDKPALTKQHVVPGESRVTVFVNDDSETSGDVSIKVSSSIPIVVERPMYFLYKGMWTGGHDVLGATF